MRPSVLPVGASAARQVDDTLRSCAASSIHDAVATQRRCPARLCAARRRRRGPARGVVHPTRRCRRTAADAADLAASHRPPTLTQFDDLGQAELTRLCDELGLALSWALLLRADHGGAYGPRDHRQLRRRAVTAVGRWSARCAPPRRASQETRCIRIVRSTRDPRLRHRRGRRPGGPGEAGRRAVRQVPIRQVHLVSVTVRPEISTFDWTELANWELCG